MRLLVPVAAGVLCLAACSDGSSDSGDAARRSPAPTSTTGTPSAGAGSTAFDEQTGSDIAKAGSAALGDVTSLRFRLAVRGGPNPTTADVRATTDGDCTGTLTVGGGRIEILGVADEQWFKADEAAWRAISPDHADRLVAAAGDHWVEDGGFEVANFCEFEDLLGPVIAEVGQGTWFAAGADRVDGHDVVRLQSANTQDGRVEAAVRTDEPHYLVTYQRTDDSDGAVSTGRFSEFDADVEVAAPADDDVVDLSRQR